MANQKRTLWDDLMEIGREIMDKIDTALNPARKQREPARVPVPVRNNTPDPYDYDQS